MDPRRRRQHKLRLVWYALVERRVGDMAVPGRKELEELESRRLVEGAEVRGNMETEEGVGFSKSFGGGVDGGGRGRDEGGDGVIVDGLWRNE